MTFRRLTSRDRPEVVAETSEALERHLAEALLIARRRAARSSPLVQALLQAATVEGLASKLNAKASAVTFRVPQLRQVWHQLYSWESLHTETPAKTATAIAWSLRENVRRHKASLSAA